MAAFTPAETSAPPATLVSVAPQTRSLPSPTLTLTLPPATALPTLAPTQPVTTTLLFVGVIVPARCVQASLDRIGDPDHPYVEVRDIISAADVAVGVFNAAMSNTAERTGCQITYQLISAPNNADAMARAGFDLMSTATNHIKDCGLMKGWCDSSLLDTLDNLRRVEIASVGAGNNLEEALQPVVFTINGVRFGFVSLGDSKMDATVFASATNPGIAHLDEANARQAIAAARKVSDVVIALPHWGAEDNSKPSWVQRDQAQYLVAAGADLVVGNHTHVVQGLQTLDGVPVFYGLGNFVFDQDLRTHRQAVILLVHFVGTRLVGYELIPTIGDRDGRAHIAAPEEAAVILQRIQDASVDLK